MTWNFAPGVGHDLGLVTKGTAEAWATFSPDLTYRYALARIWDDHGTMLVVVGLNPSTADHEVTDPTLRKLLHFAKRDGYGGLILVNVFAYRATNPVSLRDETRAGRYPIGEHNQEVIRRALEMPLLARAVAAWGKPRWTSLAPAFAKARTNGSRREWHCFGVTKGGHPRHPLYLKNDTKVRPWTQDEARRADA